MGGSERINSFACAQKHPSQLLAGRFTGVMSTLLTFGWLWIFAPILPLILQGSRSGSVAQKPSRLGRWQHLSG